MEGQGQNRQIVTPHSPRAIQTAADAMQKGLNVVDHELRNQLAGLRAITEFLMDGGSDDPALCKEFLQNLHSEILRMTRQVNDLMKSLLPEPSCDSEPVESDQEAT
jgi:signal transduction histidine kinase